ncbi:ABC transporter permease subunit [Kitasatospora sp. NPDC088779]|uniref:ABC transporter permease subunit n=1 Tax=Kitasatospora sp. NPDC088779 TaxID=3154964 RepID=UPI00344A6D37
MSAVRTTGTAGAGTRRGRIERIPGFRSELLGNERELLVHLPPGYDDDPGADYPVLYLQDGQQVFDQGQRPTWALDRTLEQLYAEGLIPELIAVGVPNAVLSPFLTHVDPADLGEKVVHERYRRRGPRRLWLDIGGREGLIMARPARELAVQLLDEAGYTSGADLLYYEDPAAPHHEDAWRPRSRHALLHLFGAPSPVVSLSAAERLRLAPGETWSAVNPVAVRADGVRYTALEAEYRVERPEVAAVSPHGLLRPLATGRTALTVGFANFTAVLTSPAIRGPFLGVLAWTFGFALLSTGASFALGLGLALTLHHPRLRGQRVYRSLMLLPYAMPAFIGILIWQSMYYRDFGLLNQLLHARVDWLGDAWNARFAVVLTSLWLGFPNMLLICTGVLQAMPAELDEAARIDGAGPWTAFRAVTCPLLLVAAAPVLISSFAFNFNNFNAIQLLTGGGPFDGAGGTAGSTDILISYTYRLAFGGQGAQYGFAAALSIVIFLLVGLITLVGFRRTRALEELNA